MTFTTTLSRSVFALALFGLLLPAASARPRGRGAVMVGGGLGWGSGFGWYDPFWGPYSYGVSPYAGTGTVKFDTDNKDTAVYVDGGYAGTVGKLKSLHLRPGTYSIELRGASSSASTQKVYVAAGKTVRVRP